MTNTIRIATRQSPLALWQAEYIRDALLALHSGLQVELLPMTTRGDKILDAPLAKVGGKGLFVKELESALLENRADIAVHSTKDVPMELPPGLVLGVICQRANPLDALVLPQGSSLAPQLQSLPQGATLGTSSLRRQCQLQVHRPDLAFVDLRGNVNTRLAKLDNGEFDAIVLAAAGLERLGLSSRISSLVEPELVLPAVGQGALSIELRDGDDRTRELLAPLHDEQTAACVLAERAMNRRLNGGCQVPIAGYARWQESAAGGELEICLEGRVGAVGGGKLLTATASGNQPEALGVAVASSLLEQGAAALLAEAYR